MDPNSENIITKLRCLLDMEELSEIKKTIGNLADTLSLNSVENEYVQLSNHQEPLYAKSTYLLAEFDQIIEAHTLERCKYYIHRLIKSFTEEKTGKINDLNLNRWKEYEDILTDSLWILDKRDKSGAHSASYWGNFIPQIPNQFLRRFTKKGDWVLDTFAGSGTTLIECKRLGRNGIGIELQPEVAEFARETLHKEKDLEDTKVQTEILVGDSTQMDYEKLLSDFGISKFQFLIMHPPYWDIIQFSDSNADLSNAKTMNDFLKKIGELIDRTYPVLEKGRHLALIISDKYANGEWIPLGFYTMQEVLKRKYMLKAILVKNFEETKGKMNQKELWRYRALAGGFYIFKHEYMYLFQKK